ATPADRCCLPGVSGSWRDVMFFFSSRRRHTRWPRDWSSDVCSSDLFKLHGRENAHLIRSEVAALPPDQRRAIEMAFFSGLTQDRSEERRVGKECRARWWPYQ